MRDLAARHTIVHLGMPDLRGVVASIDSEQRNEDAKQQPCALQREDDRLPPFECGTAITPELTELAAVPDVSDDERDRDKETRRAPATVPQGHYAIDPEPWGLPYVVQDDQEDPKPAQSRGPVVCREEGFVVSAGSRYTVLVHPDDAAGLQPLPNWENGSGCCGPTGDQGLNRACPCGAPVATLAADCFGPFELHLDPVRTYAFSQ